MKAIWIAAAIGLGLALPATAQEKVKLVDVIEIADLTGTSKQSAVHIMVQREKGGRYAEMYTAGQF